MSEITMIPVEEEIYGIMRRSGGEYIAVRAKYWKIDSEGKSKLMGIRLDGELMGFVDSANYVDTVKGKEEADAKIKQLTDEYKEEQTITEKTKKYMDVFRSTKIRAATIDDLVELLGTDIQSESLFRAISWATEDKILVELGIDKEEDRKYWSYDIFEELLESIYYDR